MFGFIPGLGMQEILLLLLLGVLLFGRKLPELGRSLGRGIAEFKKATNELQNTLEHEISADEERTKVAAHEDATHTADAPTPVSKSA